MCLLVLSPSSQQVSGGTSEHLRLCEGVRGRISGVNRSSKLLLCLQGVVQAAAHHVSMAWDPLKKQSDRTDTQSHNRCLQVRETQH